MVSKYPKYFHINLINMDFFFHLVSLIVAGQVVCYLVEHLLGWTVSLIFSMVLTKHGQCD